MARWKLPNSKVVQGHEVTDFDATTTLAPVNMTQAERDKFGLVVVVEQPQPNGKFYSSVEDVANPGAWIATPLDVAAIKATLVAEIKSYASKRLGTTDWQIIRELENVGKPAKVGVKTERAAVRQNSNDLEVEIDAMTTVEELVAWQFGRIGVD